MTILETMRHLFAQGYVWQAGSQVDGTVSGWSLGTITRGPRRGQYRHDRFLPSIDTE